VTLLVEAPSGRHFAQFHREPDSLVESVFAFLEAGLRRGNSVLVIAEPAQVERLFERLAASKLHPKSLANSGQLAVLHGDRILERFLEDGLPQWADFRSVLGPMLSRLQPFGRGIRIYSELANTLWNGGHTDAAVRVEDFWNALGGAYAFAVYCGYTMDTQCEHSYERPLEELGRTHSEILGTPEDEQFGAALDRASKEIFGISLTQMAGVTRQDGARRFPSGQRTMLWVKRNLPMSAAQLVEKARQYFKLNGGNGGA
jgi:hypothetical protein